MNASHHFLSSCREKRHPPGLPSLPCCGRAQSAQNKRWPMVLALETSLHYGSSTATQFQVCFQADCAFVPPRNVHIQLVFLLQQISFLPLTMNSVLLTFKLDLERVTTIQHVNYLGQRSVCLKVIAGTHGYRQTDSHTGPSTLLGLLQWSVDIWRQIIRLQHDPNADKTAEVSR